MLPNLFKCTLSATASKGFNFHRAGLIGLPQVCEVFIKMKDSVKLYVVLQLLYLVHTQQGFMIVWKKFDIYTTKCLKDSYKDHLNQPKIDHLHNLLTLMYF